MAILYKKEKDARDALLSGVRQLAELVTITLGPKGQNVALDKLWNDPSIVHDGVSVANEIELPDPFENMGAQLVRQAAGKTADRAGDGTTTATLLAWKMIEEGMKLIEEGANPMIMKEGMNKAVEEIVLSLQASSRPVKDGDLESVATISAADAGIGKVIAEAIERVGRDGVITVEEGFGEETTVEYKDGMMFDKGCEVPAFITDTEKMVAEISNPMILYSDLTIDSAQDLSDFLDKILTETDRNLVIIAHTFTSAALPLLIDNHNRGVIRVLAVPAPSFGHKRIWMLEDMATITGGTVITRQSGRTLASLRKEDLGRAEKVWADGSFTKIIGGKGTPEQIAERVKAIRGQMEKEESEFEKKALQERIARLTGGAAIIKVGALTDTELKDRKERIIDAVEATKSAVAEGIVAGGGIALLQCQYSLRLQLQEEKKNADSDETARIDALKETTGRIPPPNFKEDFWEGVQLVFKVLDEPIKKILENAGEYAPGTIAAIRSWGMEEKAYGFDILTREYGDMFEMGVIDPAKVTRQALENAVSVASMILTTKALITKAPEDRKSPLEKQLPLV